MTFLESIDDFGCLGVSRRNKVGEGERNKSHRERDRVRMFWKTEPAPSL